jgi:hypothetical protein
MNTLTGYVILNQRGYLRTWRLFSTKETACEVAYYEYPEGNYMVKKVTITIEEEQDETN